MLQTLLNPEAESAENGDTEQARPHHGILETTWLPALPLPIICAAGLAIRLYTLSSRSFWMDEGVSAMITRLSWSNFITLSMSREGNMSLYYLVLRVWARFGSSESYLRSLSVIFGTLTILVMYLLGKELYGRSAGLAGALALALHPFHVHFSQEARSYALLGLTLVLAAYFLVKGLRTGSDLHYLAFVILSALSFYAHFFAVFAILALLCAVPFFPARRLTLRQSAFFLALLSALIYPGMLYVWSHRNISLIDWIPSPSWDLVSRCITALTGAQGIVALTYVLALSLLLVYGSCKLGSDGNTADLTAAALPLFWGFLPGLVLLLVSLHKPILVDRYLLMSVPGMALLTAYLTHCMRKPWRIAFVAILVLVSAVSLQRSFQEYSDSTENWRGAIQYAIQHSQPDDVVLADNGIIRPIFEYYRQQFKAPYPKLNSFGKRPDEMTYADFYGITPPEVVGRVAKLHARVWTMEWGTGNALIPELERYFYSADVQTFAGVRVHLFARTATRPALP